ncbi:MAG: Fur family transcriptional regulator [Thermodesulfobacteriota bacterium]
MKISKKMQIFKSYIESHGLKSTSQRDFIATTFFKTSTHISLDELLKKVKRKTPGVGYATVYRTMKLLTESGLSIARQFGDGQTRYENIPEGGHHDHLICIKCSKIAEFRVNRIEELQNETAKKHGFTVLDHKLELYGYCPDCS